MRNFIDHDFASLKQINGENGRVYETPTGAKYPSVTAITGQHGKEAIFEWRKRVGEEEANRISKRATSRGTAIHSFCENYLLGKEAIPSIFDKEMFESIIPALDRIGDIHALESRLFSHHLEVAGTVDCIAQFDGKMRVIDFKTSRRKKTKDDIEGYFMQCAAYAVMFEEMTGISVPKCVIIMAVEDDEPLIFEEKRDDWIDMFKKYRRKYKYVKGI